MAKQLKIHVKQQAVIENIHELVDALIPLFQACNKQQSVDLILDLTNVDFITPSAMAVLAAALLYGYRKQTLRQANLKESGRKPVNRYLERMDFYELLKSPAKWSAPKQVGRRELIEATSEKMCLQVTNDLISVISSQIDLTQENSDSISYVLSELMDNVFHHAHSPINAIVCGDADADRKTVEIAIVDCGKGFRQSLSENPGLGKEIRSSREALELAIQLKVTGRPDHNSGQGLFFIVELVKENSGYGLIHSDDGELQIHQGKQVSLKAPFWQGAIVCVRFNLERPIDLVSIFNRLAPADNDFDFIDRND